MNNMRSLASVLALGISIHLNVSLYTDQFWGMKDPIGPYPRIPDEEKLKKEIAFAAECRKHIFPPKDKFL